MSEFLYEEKIVQDVINNCDSIIVNNLEFNQIDNFISKSNCNILFLISVEEIFFVKGISINLPLIKYSLNFNELLLYK